MGRVMGCGLCPYNAIEKVGNYGSGISKPKDHHRNLEPGRPARTGYKLLKRLSVFCVLIFILYLEIVLCLLFVSVPFSGCRVSGFFCSLY